MLTTRVTVSCPFRTPGRDVRSEALSTIARMYTYPTSETSKNHKMFTNVQDSESDTPPPPPSEHILLGYVYMRRHGPNTGYVITGRGVLKVEFLFLTDYGPCIGTPTRDPQALWDMFLSNVVTLAKYF